MTQPLMLSDACTFNLQLNKKKDLPALDAGRLISLNE